MRATVLIRYRSEVPEPRGHSVTEALQQLGYSEVQDARVGKLVEIDLESGDRDGARSRVEQMCERLLANPVIEHYEVISVE